MKTKYLFLTALIGLFTSVIHNASSQNFVWAKQMGGGSYNELGASIVTDVSGNVYTLGNFQGTADFDPGAGTQTLVSMGGTDVYISKLDASGNFIWIKQIGGTGNEFATGMALDASGNIYITGGVQNTVTDFDPSSGNYMITSSGFAGNFYVCKLDASGNFLWANETAGSSNAIAVDNAGNVYTTGGFGGSVDFDPGVGTYTLTTVSNDEDIFVRKLDASGNFVWAKQMGSPTTNPSSNRGNAIAVDASGNVYTTGFFAGNGEDFDPGSGTYLLSSIDQYTQDIFISKLNSSGNFVWAKQIGGDSAKVGNAIAVDASGNVYTTGYISGTADFNPGSGNYSLTSTGNADMFVSKLDVSGNFVWAKLTGGSDNDRGTAITVDNMGNSYTIGLFTGTVDFDPGIGMHSLTSAGGVDISIRKLNSSGNFLWADQMGGSNSDIGFSITLDSSGAVYSTGEFYSANADFNPGPGTTAFSASTGGIFISKLGCSPSVTITSNNSTTFCAGDSITLNASVTNGIAPYTYSWSPGGQTDSSITVSPLANTTYSVTVTATGGCAPSMGIINTTVNATAAATAGADQTVCPGSNIMLAGSIGGSATAGTWSGGMGTFSDVHAMNATYQPTFSEITAGSVTLTLTTTDLCLSPTTDQVTITFLQGPSANAGSDQIICSGNTVSLSGTLGGTATTGSWSGGTGTFSNSSVLNTTYTPSATDISAGSVTLTLTTIDSLSTSCIVATDQMVITINPSPIVHITTDTSVCGCITLYAGNPGATYIWNTGTNYSTVTTCASGVSSALFWVVVSNGTCTGSDTINVTIHPCPIVNLGPDISLSSGGSVTLDAGNPGASYLWNTLATTKIITVSQTGTYWVRVTDTLGYKGSDTIVIAKPNGIADISNEHYFKIYPNPSNGTFNLNFIVANKQNVIIKMIDYTGKEVYKETIENFVGEYNKNMNVPDYLKGVFFLQVTANGKEYTNKITIIK
jgi:hypothetical protein